MRPIEELLRAGGATLAFDTNAVIARDRRGKLSFSGFFWLCDGVNVLRSGPPPLGISLVVPALVRMEAFHDLRTELAGRSIPFDPDMVETTLKDKQVAVAHFDERAALEASAVLHRWYPTDEGWQRAKLERCREALGGAASHADGYGLASIDWAIAAQAEARGWVLVTDDERAEFRDVSRKIKKSSLRALLEELLRERGLSVAHPARDPGGPAVRR
jgi:hypothetical protein